MIPSKNFNILLSVKNIMEIQNIMNYADIVDLKNPNIGALGAWKKKDIILALRRFKSKKIISATLGNIKDLKILEKKLFEYDELGLSFLKIGCFFNSISELKDLISVIKKKKNKTKMVLVFFAENYKLLDELNNNWNILLNGNFDNILIDTLDKKKDGLLKKININFLELFIKNAEKIGINVGLAGKIKFSELIKIKNLKPKIVGFRSAICEKRKRSSEVSSTKAKQIYDLFNSEIKKAHEVAGT